MRKDGHPDYHEITVVMTDGTEFKTRSTYGKPGDTLRLDIDPKTHPAWTGEFRLANRGSQMAKYSKRFGALGGGEKQETAAPAASSSGDNNEPKIKLTTTGSKKKKAS